MSSKSGAPASGSQRLIAPVPSRTRKCVAAFFFERCACDRGGFAQLLCGVGCGAGVEQEACEGAARVVGGRGEPRVKLLRADGGEVLHVLRREAREVAEVVRVEVRLAIESRRIRGPHEGHAGEVVRDERGDEFVVGDGGWIGGVGLARVVRGGIGLHGHTPG